jgi:hypothetical protein
VADAIGARPEEFIRLSVDRRERVAADECAEQGCQDAEASRGQDGG